MKDGRLYDMKHCIGLAFERVSRQRQQEQVA